MDPLSNPAVLWLITGTVLVLLEVMLIPGIGFLFAGLAAITVGGLIINGMLAIDAGQWQFIWFFLLTAGWAGVLWYPMKRLRYKTSSEAYKNIIGQTAIVKDIPLTKNTGRVQWSGTLMDARIAKQSPLENIPLDTVVEIVDIQGSRVFVVPHLGNSQE